MIEPMQGRSQPAFTLSSLIAAVVLATVAAVVLAVNGNRKTT